MRDMRRISGSFAEVTDSVFYEAQEREDYLEITLTDDSEVPGAFSRLRSIYPNLLSLRYEGTERSFDLSGFTVKDLEETDPFDFVAGFFRDQTGKDLKPEQEDLLKGLMAELWGGDAE